MPARERRFRWTWWFDAPPARVWPLVSNTDRVNRLAGLPGTTYVRTDAPGREHVLNARQTFYGLVPVTYEEDPFEWVEEGRFQVERRFARGPASRLRVDCRLLPDPRGTRVAMELAVTPRSVISALLVPAMMRSARKGHDRAYAVLQREAAGAGPSAPTPSRLEARVLARLGRAGDALPRALAARLASHLATAEAGDLRRIRPYALADRLRAPRPAVLAACLHAVRAGALDLAFESLCPHCRGAQRTAQSLAEVRSGARCEGCGLDFEVELDRNLEAVFRPAADLRRVPTETYCLGGPGTTPHVVAQARIAPGGAVTVEPRLEAGSYRLRAARAARSALLRVAPDAEPGAAPAEVAAELAPGGVRLTGPSTARAGRVAVHLRNGTGSDAVLVLERVRWLDDAATALDVLAVPGFQDLFAEQVLAPGERVAVRRIALLFTDLRGSTALYRRLGDAAAYALVRDHFRALGETIHRHEGMLVKTIGDAVMAGFRAPVQAVAAALEMHRTVAALVPPDGAGALVLKAGVHQGASIAVNAGGRLDFFGSTPNLAARAQHEASGGDVVVTEEVLADDEVRRLLASVPHRAERFSAVLKGFEAPVPLHRITPRDAA